MEKKVLFEITEDLLETGLRGMPVGYCTTSVVDPLKGIFYRGKSIEEVCSFSPEEVIFLLFYGKRGSSEEIHLFQEELKKRGTLNPKTIEKIEALPEEGHPMKLLSMALLIASIYEGSGDYREDALNMIAKAPYLVALVMNHHQGIKTPKNSPSLDYIERFYDLLAIPKGGKKELLPLLKTFYILHMDHGGGNLSTFVGKAVASSLEDIWGSMTAAMCALEGPRHGKANQDALEFAENLLKEVYEEGKKIDPLNVKNALEKRLEEHQLIFGFGHAVLKVEDPRASVLYKIAEEKYGQNPLIQLILLLRTVGGKVLQDNPKIHDPYPNVDAVSGGLLKVAGFPYPEYFTVLFGFSRMAGIARQIVYERLEAREGKGTPIVRPKYIYKEEVSL